MARITIVVLAVIMAAFLVFTATALADTGAAWCTTTTATEEETTTTQQTTTTTTEETTTTTLEETTTTTDPGTTTTTGYTTVTRVETGPEPSGLPLLGLGALAIALVGGAALAARRR